MSFFSILRRKWEERNEPIVQINNDSWIHKEFVIGAFEKRAKHASVVLEDGRIFVFGGQTDKKEVDNSCFIIEERAMNATVPPKDNFNALQVKTTRLRIQARDLRRRAIMMQTNNNSLRYYVTSPPIMNPHESPPGLRSHTAVRYEDKIIIFGGKNKQFSNNTYILNTTTWYVSNIYIDR